MIRESQENCILRPQFCPFLTNGTQINLISRYLKKRVKCRGFRLKKRNMLEALNFELNKPGCIQTFEKLALRCQFTTLGYLINVLRLLFFSKKFVISLPKRGKIKELKSRSKANLQSSGILQNHYYETRSPVEMKKKFLKIH